MLFFLGNNTNHSTFHTSAHGVHGVLQTWAWAKRVLGNRIEHMSFIRVLKSFAMRDPAAYWQA